MCSEILNHSLLAIDCATGNATVCLWHEGREYLASQQQDQKQASALIPLIETVLSEARIWYNAIGAVAVCIGPGSFTGIRIGLAAARGIGLAANLPLIGVTTLEALAWGVLYEQPEHPNAKLTCVLKAGKGQLYTQSFQLENAAIKAITTPAIVDPESFVLGDAELVGDPHPLLDYTPTLGMPTRPEARYVALASTQMEVRSGPFSLRPLYIRPPDATPPTENRLQGQMGHL